MKNLKRKGNKGFTLAEMLIVVAIVIVLAAVSFVAVQRHQRSLYQMEFDGIAREIYFAAQNHLTQADTQGLVALTDKSKSGNNAEDYTNLAGIGGTTEKLSDVYYYVGPRASGDADDVLSLMLPANAVDINNSVGGSGTFFILYQKSTATVMDVFYTSTDSRFGIGRRPTNNTSFVEDDYTNLMALRGDSQKNARNRAGSFSNAIIGYYGGEPAQDQVITLKAPELKVENGDQLLVTVTNPNTDTNGLKYATLQLIIKGVDSKQTKTLTLLKPGASEDTASVGTENYISLSATGDYSKIKIVLDDITDDAGHFASKFTNFYPGEDLEIQAKVFSSNTYANIAWSAMATTNSLFADPYAYDTKDTSKSILGTDIKNKVVAIASIRHLENLDANVSKLGDGNTDYTIEKAGQIKDLDWSAFNNNTPAVVPLAGTGPGEGNYLPVVPAYQDGANTAPFALSYDGQNHSISNVKIGYSSDAGLFGKLIAKSEVKNLELIDFSIITTGGNAGALVGTATGTDTDTKKITITNVLAHNSEGKDNTFNNNVSGGNPNVSASGSAGGLIGSATYCKVEKSAAALYVKSTAGAAGGLIGTSSGGSVNASYSGGHTCSDEPNDAATKYDDGVVSHKSIYPARYYDKTNKPMYNVIAGTTAGGLIGVAVNTGITNSYSTCSASGTTVGGFIGTGSGNITITDCYCTGLVPHTGSTTIGAFAGSFSGSAENCKYFEIVNEIRNMKGDYLTSGYSYLTAGAKTGENDTGAIANVAAFDANASVYNTFTSGTWQAAHPYDPGLGDYYQDKYNLKTVAQLGASVTTDDFVIDHYGDWPAPEEFIFIVTGS